MSKDKKTKNDASKDNEGIKDFKIKINEFGEITSNMNVDKLNEFLNENVEDKKLKDREKELDEE